MLNTKLIGGMVWLGLVACGGSGTEAEISQDAELELIAACTAGGRVGAETCNQVTSYFQRWGCSVEMGELGVATLRSEVANSLANPRAYDEYLSDEQRARAAERAAVESVSSLYEERCTGD